MNVSNWADVATVYMQEKKRIHKIHTKNLF